INLVFVFIIINFPAGVLVYYVVSMLVQVFQYWLLSRGQPAPALAGAGAGAPARLAVPNKANGGAKSDKSAKSSQAAKSGKADKNTKDLEGGSGEAVMQTESGKPGKSTNGGKRRK